MLDKEFGCELGSDFKRHFQHISLVPIQYEQHFNSTNHLAVKCVDDTYAKLEARTRRGIQALYAKDMQFWEYHCLNSTQNSTAKCERRCHNHTAEWARKCAWAAGSCTACSHCGPQQHWRVLQCSCGSHNETERRCEHQRERT